MAKNSIRDYSATNSSNTDIQSIDISEGCSPAGINNAIREVMADLKDVSTGAVALESPAADSLSVTGDLTVDTNTLYVDSTNNRVGIGTTPAWNFHTYQSGPLNSVFESNTGNSNIRITSGDGDIAQIMFGDQTNDTISQIKHDNSDNSLAFYTAGANERMRLDTSGNLKFNSGYGSVATAYGVRSWVYFDASTGTPVIQNSGNVSSLGDEGVGRYQINFSTSMPDVNYAVVGTSHNSSSDVAGMVGRYNTTTNNVDVTTARPNGTYIDANRTSFIVVR